MKKFYVILIVLFFPYYSIQCIDTEYLLEVKSSIKIDSIVSSIKSLSGEQKVFLNGDSTYIPTRNSSFKEINIAEKWLFEKFQSLKYEPNYHSFQSNINGQLLKNNNIITIKPGLVSTEPYIVFSAHFDAIIHPTSFYTPGADDNASGCAVVLEAARLLKNIKTKHGIIFALFSAEEYGLFGSSAYISSNKHVYNIDFAINNDMVGSFSQDTTVLLTLSQVNLDKFLNILKMINVNTEINHDFERWNMSASDHASFIYEGIDAVTFHESKFSPVYHSANDKMEHIDTAYLKRNAILSILTLLAMAEPIPEDIDDFYKESMLQIYPIPFKNEVSIAFYSDLNCNTDIILYNNTGKEVLKQNISLTQGYNNISITGHNLPKGIYHFKIQIGKKIKSGNIIKV